MILIEHIVRSLKMIWLRVERYLNIPPDPWVSQRGPGAATKGQREADWVAPNTCKCICLLHCNFIYGLSEERTLQSRECKWLAKATYWCVEELGCQLQVAHRGFRIVPTLPTYLPTYLPTIKSVMPKFFLWWGNLAFLSLLKITNFERHLYLLLFWFQSFEKTFWQTLKCLERSN